MIIFLCVARSHVSFLDASFLDNDDDGADVGLPDYRCYCFR